MGIESFIPTLLGITYEKSKALPNKNDNCLIPAMHIGQKLKQIAEEKGLRPVDVAGIFGVRPPSVYDWYENGRIHKKHYPILVSFSEKPIEWWLDMPAQDNVYEVRETRKPYGVIDPRHEVLTDLFDALPSKEQDDLIRTLTEKKQHYEALIDEMLSRRNAA
jgi:hypothetical protein